MYTPAQRDEWIQYARTSDPERQSGACSSSSLSSSFHFKKYPKVLTPTSTDHSEQSSRLTHTVNDLIYTTLPVFRKLALHVYRLLVDKITEDALLNYYHYFGYIRVLVKGSNAYAYLIDHARFRKHFPFSDLDIVVCIDPKLNPQEFKTVHARLTAVIFQVLSLHKKTLDHMFFLTQFNPSIREMLMHAEAIDAFESLYQAAVLGDVKARSMFNDTELRNQASRHSFILTDCANDPDHVVKIDVPHFPENHKLPLQKTPVFCSYNNCIRKDAEDYTHHFDLFRLKLNNVFPGVREEEHGPESVRAKLSVSDDATDDPRVSLQLYVKKKNNASSPPMKTYASDIVDITLLHQDDTELQRTWASEDTWKVMDPFTHIEVLVPHIDALTEDLARMIHVYDCPDFKKEKRQKKYDIMKMVCDAYHRIV